MATTTPHQSQASLNLALALSAVGAAAWYGWAHLSPGRRDALVFLALELWDGRSDPAALVQAHTPLFVGGLVLMVALSLLWRAFRRTMRRVLRPPSDTTGRSGATPRASRSPSREGGGDTAGGDTTTPRGRGETHGGALPAQDVAQVASAAYGLKASYWAGIVAAGNVVMLHGAPKAGKSSWLAELVAAVVAGTPYMGEPTTRTSVVYVSEELAQVFQGKARRMAGGALPPCPWYEAVLPPGPLCHTRASGTSRAAWWLQRRPIAWVSWRWQRTGVVRGYYRLRGVQRVWHVPIPLLGYRVDVDTLPRLVGEVEAFARSVGARIIVYDTLKAVAATAITSVSHAETFVQEMKGSAARGFCTVVVHHDKEDGTMQGPKNLYGGVDFDLHQRAPKGSREGDTTREIVPTGRFDRLAPEPWVYRMDKGTGRLEQVGAPRSPHRVSNPEPPAPMSVALPLSYGGKAAPLGLAPVSTAASLAPLPLPVLTPPTPRRSVAVLLGGTPAPVATARSLPEGVAPRPEGGASRPPPSTHPQPAPVGPSANSLPAPLPLPVLTPPSPPAAPSGTTPSPILEWLQQHDPATPIPSRDIYAAMGAQGMTHRSCKVELKALWEAGKVEREGQASRGYLYRARPAK